MSLDYERLQQIQGPHWHKSSTIDQRGSGYLILIPKMQLECFAEYDQEPQARTSSCTIASNCPRKGGFLAAKRLKFQCRRNIEDRPLFEKKFSGLIFADPPPDLPEGSWRLLEGRQVDRGHLCTTPRLKTKQKERPSIKAFWRVEDRRGKSFFTTVRDQKKKAEGAWKHHPTMEPGTNTVRTELQLQREGGTM